jgi:hypothetical protein
VTSGFNTGFIMDYIKHRNQRFDAFCNASCKSGILAYIENVFSNSLLIVLVFSLCPVSASTQPDTIIVYDVQLQQISTVYPVAFDTSAVFDHTSSFRGMYEGSTLLSLDPPTENLFAGSQFSQLKKAGLNFDVTDYPVRTAVKIFGWRNDSILHNCSGLLVGENLVLTAAHCLSLFNTQEWLFDSMFIVPAYDNGVVQYGFDAATIDKYYLFSKYYYGRAWVDIAILQTRTPTGKKAGYTGIAFSRQSSYFSDKVFHKLSYPSWPDPLNPAIIYTGDTLYYNYGFIDVMQQFLGIDSPEAFGIPGQSGSSIFYTDNTEYYSFGVLSYGRNYKHYQITNHVFYQLRNIIENVANLSPLLDLTSSRVDLYPNPASSYFIVDLNSQLAKSFTFWLYDSNGQLIHEIKNSDSHLYVDRRHLASGIYFYKVITERSELIRGKLIFL